MRFSTAFSLISATGALASNYGVPMADMPVYETPTSAAMAHETAPSSMVHDAVPSAPIMHDTTTTTAAMMHDTTMAAYTASLSPPIVHEGPKTHTVIVGGPSGLVYSPSKITAKVNDIVHFVFMSQNHTVTESTFAKPCNKKATDAPDSGFMSNPNNTRVPAPTWDYTVAGTDPTWWYCKQRTGNHCGKGMVFAINPTVEKSFDEFKMAAISINGTVAATSTAAGFTATAVGTVTLIADSSIAATPTAPATPPDAPVTPPDAPATPPDAVATATPSPIVPGWNDGSDGSCQCACFCGVGAYPAGDGIGAYGGYGGSLPAPW